MGDNEPTYSKPPTQAFAEAVAEDDYQAPTVKAKGEDPTLSDDGFVNVAPEYRNFANETDKPLVGDEGAEADIESAYVADDADYNKGATDNGESGEDDEDDEEETGSGSGGSSGSGYTPPTPPQSPQS